MPISDLHAYENMAKKNIRASSLPQWGARFYYSFKSIFTTVYIDVDSCVWVEFSLVTENWCAYEIELTIKVLPKVVGILTTVYIDVDPRVWVKFLPRDWELMSIGIWWDVHGQVKVLSQVVGILTTVYIDVHPRVWVKFLPHHWELMCVGIWWDVHGQVEVRPQAVGILTTVYIDVDPRVRVKFLPSDRELMRVGVWWDVHGQVKVLSQVVETVDVHTKNDTHHHHYCNLGWQIITMGIISALFMTENRFVGLEKVQKPRTDGVFSCHTRPSSQHSWPFFHAILNLQHKYGSLSQEKYGCHFVYLYKSGILCFWLLLVYLFSSYMYMLEMPLHLIPQNSIQIVPQCFCKNLLFYTSYSCTWTL